MCTMLASMDYQSHSSVRPGLHENQLPLLLQANIFRQQTAQLVAHRASCRYRPVVDRILPGNLTLLRHYALRYLETDF